MVLIVVIINSASLNRVRFRNSYVVVFRKLLTIPRSDNPNFQCNSEYGDTDSKGYRCGDFVLDENNANKEQAINAKY